MDEDEYDDENADDDMQSSIYNQPMLQPIGSTVSIPLNVHDSQFKP